MRINAVMLASTDRSKPLLEKSAMINLDRVDKVIPAVEELGKRRATYVVMGART